MVMCTGHIGIHEGVDGRKEEEDTEPLLAVLTAITTQKTMQQVCISSYFRRTSSGETDGAIS